MGDADLAAGHKVGEYVVDEKIGQGGFGAVFRATHPLIGKLAAVKVLSRKYSSDPEVVSRFIAEARAVNQIRHRHIIDIFSFGELDDGRSYYVMELLDGEPLDVRLEGGALSLEEAVRVLRSIARALDAAHAAGIAHRDLKPANIFLVHEDDGDLFPKLLDFGIAKLLGDATALHKTRTGTPIGTPMYMSPEQCRGEGIDHRTDIYSFGCVAYEVLTGRVPFDADNHLEIMMKQIGEEPVSPSTIVPELPAAVDEAIAWMMKKDPAARPPTLGAAIAALEQAAGIPPTRASQPVITPPHGVRVVSPSGSHRTPSQSGKRSSSRDALAHTLAAEEAPRRRWWLAGGLALALIGGAIALSLTRHHDAPTPTPAAPAASTEVVAPSAAPVTAPVESPPPTPVEPPIEHEAAPAPKPRPVAKKPLPKPAAPVSDPYSRE
jgi:serine/threonine-protein kinase